MSEKDDELIFLGRRLSQPYIYMNFLHTTPIHDSRIDSEIAFHMSRHRYPHIKHPYPHIHTRIHIISFPWWASKLGLQRLTFHQYILAHATKWNTGAAVVKSSNKICKFFGWPLALYVDNRAHFVKQELLKLLSMEGVGGIWRIGIRTQECRYVAGSFRLFFFFCVVFFLLIATLSFSFLLPSVSAKENGDWYDKQDNPRVIRLAQLAEIRDLVRGRV